MAMIYLWLGFAGIFPVLFGTVLMMLPDPPGKSGSGESDMRPKCFGTVHSLPGACAISSVS